MAQRVITVTQLNRYVKALFSENKLLNEMMVQGEISNFIRHYKSGHLYFTLKDKESSIKAVMFRGDAQFLQFQPENGMAVIVTGAVTLYERDGSYQIYVKQIQPDGIGTLYLAFEQLKEKLSREGLFAPEQKRPLPKYPEKIGIVTSEGAAALQDMLRILARRAPSVRILLSPAQVQGEGAAESLIEGLIRLRKTDCDVIIIGRGGGSMEDLWAFNNEKLARTIASSPIPVISAVGHETDFTIADFAADLRAPTPSAAAELAVSNTADVLYYLDSLWDSCYIRMQQNLKEKERRLQELKRHLVTPMGVLEQETQRFHFVQHRVFLSMQRRLDLSEVCLREAGKRVAFSMEQKLCRSRERLQNVARLIEASSPVRLLERGYCGVMKEGKAVTSISDVAEGDQLVTQVADGSIFSQVTGRKKKYYNKEENRHGKTDDPGRSH